MSVLKRKRQMALLIAAHNEELVLGETIRSAIAAGMNPADIYVVNDSSTDATTATARQLLPTRNVASVRRSGKGIALGKARSRFGLCQRYRWIHIADADGLFAPNYFRTFRKTLRVKYGAATGYVRSLPGSHVSQYRVFEYTIGMELHRRFQSMAGVISVIPGPTSCFRNDVFEQLDFSARSLTEDFDVTLQLYRKKLGRILYVRNAIAYTQDPRTIRDFVRQVSRWNKGVLLDMRRHKVGTRPKAIDAYLSYQILQNLLFFANYFIWVPYLAATKDGLNAVAAAFLTDVVVTFFLTILVCLRSRRWDVLSAFPYIYLLKWLNLAIFLKIFIQVMLLRRRYSYNGQWANGTERRYAHS